MATNKYYIALGYKDNKNIVWSNFRNAFFYLDENSFKMKTLINILGREFVEQFNNIDDIIEQISTECVNAGIINLDNQKGFGVFIHPINKDKLVINTDEIFSTDDKFNGYRVINKVIFNNIKDLKINKHEFNIYKDKKPVEAFHRVKDVVKSFNFIRGEQDVNLLLGWMLSSFLCGTLNWRTHASITGARGTGKSTLQELIKNILGGNAILMDGDSTMAGITQLVGQSSCAILLDESESDGNKLANILKMLRSASSGATVYRGTSDQKGLSFELRACGLLTGIVPPRLNGADSSRFLRIEMLKREDQKKVDDLLKDIEKQQYYGKLMWYYMIDNYVLFKSICKEVRYLLLNNYNDARYADTYTTLISAYYMCYEYKSSIDKDDIEKFIKNIDLTAEREQSQVRDEEELLNIILKKQIKLNDSFKTIVELLDYKFFEQYKDSEKRNATISLQRYGIKTDDKYFYINTKDLELKQLLKDTRFYNGDLTSVLKRLDGVELIKDSIMLGGIRTPRSSVIKIKYDSNKFGYNEDYVNELTNNIPEFKGE